MLKKKISSIIVQKSFKSLKADYLKKINSNNKLPKKYIYFLLPYQPECTNLPQGGIFHDIFLVISMLSKNIPKDWKILVKEHPLQFKNDTNLYGFIGRDINFYKRLLQIEKVILIDNSKVDHFTLLDNSEFVSLINGTAGWEALVRNKKVIIFGEVFYSYAPNVFKINKSNQIKNIIKRKNIYNFDQKFINFVNAVIDTGQIIFFNYYNAKIRNKKFNYVENKIKIQKAIMEVLR
jgi:capsule polysaccharide export protein KpsC/LpsZ